jgi:hypothetical protein
MEELKEILKTVNLSTVKTIELDWVQIDKKICPQIRIEFFDKK